MIISSISSYLQMKMKFMKMPKNGNMKDYINKSDVNIEINAKQLKQFNQKRKRMVKKKQK